MSMMMLWDTVRLFACDERGADLIEYALVTGVIVTGCVVALGGLAASIVEFLNSLIDVIPASIP